MRNLTTQTLKNFALLLVAILLCPYAQVAQVVLSTKAAKLRTIEVIQMANQPLELLDISHAGSSIKNKRDFKHRSRIAEVSEISFVSQQNWLKDVKFRFKNISGKSIISMRSEMVFKHSASELPLAIALTVYSRDKRVAEDASALAPSEEMTMELSEEGCNAVRDFMKNNGGDGDVVRTLFDIGEIRFSDGTSWLNGRFFRKDPGDSTKWVPDVTQQGVRNNRWSGAKLILATYTPLSPQDTETCAEVGGYIEYYCSTPGCTVRTDLSSSYFGCNDFRNVTASCINSQQGGFCSNTRAVTRAYFNYRCDCGL